MEDQNDLFVFDTEKEEASDLKHFLSTISSSLVSIDLNKSEEELCFGLIPKGMSIKEAYDACPIKAEYFKSIEKKEKKKKSSKFKNELLSSLDSFLEELTPKKYEFITDGIETKKDISHLGMSERQLKKLNRKEREKTKGDKWFNMKAPEMTEELKNDLQILQMRSALDPKQFYKRSEMKTLPKYFEIGRVVDAPVEYHSSKNTRKRNKTLVDELMEDAEFQKFNKKKFQEHQAEKQKQPNFKRFKKGNKVSKK